MIKGIVIICMLALGAGYYLEYVEHLMPCLLCVAQRVAFYMTGIFACILLPMAAKHKTWRGLLQLSMLLSSIAGLYFAGKQLYLESLPAALRPACTIPFEALVRAQEWGAAFLQLIQGTSDCGEKQWEFLHMSLAFWSGCIFLVLIGFILANTLAYRTKSS